MFCISKEGCKRLAWPLDVEVVYSEAIAVELRNKFQVPVTNRLKAFAVIPELIPFIEAAIAVGVEIQVAGQLVAITAAGRATTIGAVQMGAVNFTWVP